MRWLSLLSLVLFASCTAWDRSNGETRYSTPLTFAKPDPEDPLANLDPDFPVAPAARTDRPPPPTPAAAPTPPGPPQSRAAARVHRLTTRNGLSLTILRFDDREFSLAVADKARGPETQWQSSQAAARDHDALAALNASFFTPGGDPLGLVIENGARHGSWNRGSSLTSGVLAVRASGPQILRREQWRASNHADHLLQAGPMLLENARIIAGLSDKAERPRSFIAWDGNHHWIIGTTNSATLAALSTALASQPVPGSRLTTALNLDGGRSSDFWVSPSIKGGPVSTRRFWNKPVRNYVLVAKRSSP